MGARAIHAVVELLFCCQMLRPNIAVHVNEYFDHLARQDPEDIHRKAILDALQVYTAAHSLTLEHTTTPEHAPK